MTFRLRFRQLSVMVGRELRQLLRDPVALVLTLVAPIAAAIIAGAALGSPPAIDATVVVVGGDAALRDPGELTNLLTENDDDASPPLQFLFLEDAEAAHAMVADGDADAALILPADDSPVETPVRVVVNKNSLIVGDLTESGARTLAARLSADAASDADIETVPAVQLQTIAVKGRALNGYELYGPVIGVFFLFLTAGFVARRLLDDRELGTLSRLRTIPISSGMIAAGKVVTMLIVGAVELVMVFATMSIFYDADWGNPLALAAVGIAIALAVGSISLLIASFADTPQAAHMLEMSVALGFAVLGGYLVPLQNLPEFAGPVARVMPNGVAIGAMRDIAANGRGLTDVLGPILVILAFAAIVGTVGHLRVRRVVES